MTMLSPMGRVPKRRPPRRPAPAFVVLGVLVVIAIVVWWQVFHPAEPATSQAAACTPKPGADIAQTDPSTIEVRVYNATDRVGLATGVSDELTKRGFTVVATSNDPLGKNVAGVGEIRFGPDGAQQAAFLSFHIPGVEMLRDDRTSAVVDIALGQQYAQLTLPAEAQQAAQQAAAEAQSSPGDASECG